jgi:hypothetical protein
MACCRAKKPQLQRTPLKVGRVGCGCGAVSGLGICRHPVTCPGFRNKINQMRVTGGLRCKSGLRIRRRGASLSVTPPALVPSGLRRTGYGATAKIRGGWGGFQHASFPVFRGAKRHTLPPGRWKTETGDQIGMQLMARSAPLSADRGDFPISILDSLVCPVFGEQIGIVTESLRPLPDLRGNCPI